MPDTAVHAHSPWERLARAVIECRRAADGAPVDAVVCPSPDSASRLLRHVACSALIRTRGGSLRMLRTIGQPWTDALLAAAETFLAAEEAQGPSAARARTAERRLARALELPQVEVVAPALDRPDPAQWQTRGLAVALRMRQLATDGATPLPAVLAAQVDSIEAALVGRLRVALETIVNGLDREELAAMAASRGDGRLYAFLAEPGRRRNRLQLAETFPLFLRAAATGEPGSAGALIRAATDAGAPLVDTLARHWAVRRSVLRGLQRCPVEVAGERWETNLDALVVTLDALPPESRPGAEPAGWRAFNEHLDFAATVFARRPWASPLALGWLRHAARHGWTRASLQEAGSALTEEAVAAVDVLRQALIDAISADVATPAATVADHAPRAWLAADRCLAGMAPRRLVELARRYRRELAAATAELAGEIQVATGTGFWPLLPGDYVSADGSRIVVSLTTRHALRRQGTALQNCLGNAHLAAYAAACRRGGTFIVAVLDAAMRAPLSTAAVHVSRSLATGTVTVRLAEHTGLRNAPPSASCGLAVREVLALARTSSYQQHLREVMRAIAARDRDELAGRRQARLLPLRLAVRRTLGEQRYAELLKVARGEQAAAAT
jgi:hypothetical protein